MTDTAHIVQRRLLGASPVDTDDVYADVIEAEYEIGLFGTLSLAGLTNGTAYPEDNDYYIARAWVHHTKKDGTKIARVRAVKHESWPAA